MSMFPSRANFIFAAAHILCLFDFRRTSLSMSKCLPQLGFVTFTACECQIVACAIGPTGEDGRDLSPIPP